MQRIPSPFDVSDKHTEWSAASVLLDDWVNAIIKEKQLSIGPARVEKIGVDRRRPDGLIYEAPKRALLLIEFKPPAFDPFDETELKEPARKKATKRRISYFATSNFRDLILFNTERVNSMEPEERQIINKYHLSEIYDLDLIETPNFRNSIKKGLEELLLDLIEIKKGKKPEPRLPIDEFLILRLQEKINTLSFYYQQIIKETVEKDPDFTKKIALWFNEQNWSFAYQEQDYEKAARQAAYLLVNKILFYDVLQVKRPQELDPLEIPEGLTKGGRLQKTLQAFFDDVLEIDYETIYSTDFIDQIAFPDNLEVVRQVKELVKVLNRYDFSKLGFDIIGRIFEKLIPPQERHRLGQYFTHPDVVDIILRFALRHEKDKVFDPGCGAGTFLVRAYQHKKLMNPRLDLEEILPTLWGNDIAKFPAHLATINLAVNDLSSSENYPRIIQKDFFEWLPGKVEIPESSRKVFLKGLGKKEKQELIPRYFDCVVGNPPYTRQEEITDIADKDKDYKEKLIARALRNVQGKEIADISKRAGLYAYFFVHGAKFLQNGGRFGFIVSNSWLDVDYGKGLQEFFLKNYKITAIIESKVERWFEEADINTCIVLLEKAGGEKFKKERDSNLVRFVYLKKPLRHFIPPASNMWEEKIERRDAVDRLFKMVFGHKEFYENEEIRIFPKKQEELWEEGFDGEKAKYEGAKWGKYLRAPDIYFKVLEKSKNKLIPFKKIASVQAGIKSGANEFFYLTEEKLKQKAIEEEFWTHIEEGKPVKNYLIESPSKLKSIKVSREKLRKIVLFVHKNKKILKKRRVYSYINEGERKGYNKRKTCDSRARSREGRWFDLEGVSSRVIWPEYVRERLLVFYSENEVFINNRLYQIKSTKINEKIIWLILNSTLFQFLVEVNSPQPGGGGGPRGTRVYDLGNVLFPSKIAKTASIKLLKLFDSFNEVGSIFQEIGTKDSKKALLRNVRSKRRELDRIVMGEILGLDEKEQLEIYKAVVDLVKSRLEKAKSISKSKKTKGGMDLDLLVNIIMKKIGPQSLGKFYKTHILKRKELTEKSLPAKTDKIKIDKTLMDYRLISGKNSIDCSTEEEARFLKVFLEADWEGVKMPKDRTYLKKILPKLEKISKRIKEAIEYYTGSVLDQRTREQIEDLVWQKTSEIK